MTAAAEPAAQALSALFAAPVRWGWELVPPPSAALSPERNNPPTPRPPRLIPRYQAAGLMTAAIVVTVGALLTLYVAPSGVYGNVLGIVPRILGAALVFWVASAYVQARVGYNPNDSKNLLQLGGAALAALLLPQAVLPLAAIIVWYRVLRGRSDLVPDPKDVAKLQAEHQAAVTAWQKRISQFETAEQKREQTVDVWYPIVPTSTAQTICTFGGTEISWAAALATFGTSLLGSGSNALVIDLSRRRAADVLLGLAIDQGIPAAQMQLPADRNAAGLLANLTWDDLSTVLVEILYSAHESVEQSRQGRLDDRAILREVAECLTPSGPVSFARLRQAMLVVEGASETKVDGAITTEEFDKLSQLYNQVQREHGGVMERVTRIERVLRGFDNFRDGGGADQQSLMVRGQDGNLPRLRLQIVTLDKRLDNLDHDRLADLVFQLLVRRLRVGSIAAQVLVVLGADRIRRTALESMSEFAVQDRLKVLFFFEHLREDAIQMIGAGGAAAAFFALGNHREAKEASDFIGAGYKWVESQHTRSEGDSLTRSWGVEASDSYAETQSHPVGSSVTATRSMGSSYSAAFGKSNEYSVSEQRVREAVLEPEIVQGLPVTGMIWVEVRDKGQRVAANVDCNPQITFAPRVSRQPRALPPAR